MARESADHNEARDWYRLDARCEVRSMIELPPELARFIDEIVRIEFAKLEARLATLELVINQRRIHSARWCEDGVTLSIYWDLADGTTGVQHWRIGRSSSASCGGWRIGEPVSEVRQLVPPPGPKPNGTTSARC